MPTLSTIHIRPHIPVLLALLLPVFASCRSSVGVTAESQPPSSSSSAVPSEEHEPRAITAGVYSGEQAERGSVVFERVCGECHKTANFTASGFHRAWEGKSMRSLFNTVRSTMPERNPGGLSNQEYADVITYILKINRLPAGESEMPATADALANITIHWPTDSNNIP